MRTGKFLLAAGAAAAVTALLAACASSSSSSKGQSTATPTPQPSPSAGASVASSVPPLTEEDTETTIDIVTEGDTTTVPAIRHRSALGFVITYLRDEFVPDSNSAADFILRSERDEAAKRPESGLTVTVYEGQSAENTAEQIAGEHNVDETSVTTFGQGEYTAQYLIGTEGEGKDEILTEYYITEQGGKTYVILLYCGIDMAEGHGAWLHAMLNSIAFEARM